MASLTERLYARTTQGKKEDEEKRKVQVGIVTNKGSNVKDTEKTSDSDKKDTSKSDSKTESKSSLTERLYARTTEGRAGGNPASPGIVSSQQNSARRRFEDIYGELSAAEERVNGYKGEIDSWASRYGATSDNIMDTLATKYGAQKNESGSYIFSEQSSLDEFNRLMDELSGMYDKYNTGLTSYNDLFNQANTYDWKSAKTELESLEKRLKEAKSAVNNAQSAFATGTELGAAGAEYDFLKKDYEDKQAKYNELLEQVTALNRDIKNAEFFQNSVHYNDYLSKDGIENYTGEVKHKQSEYMTEDEMRIYNYLYQQEGAQAAQEYMDYLAETLNYREGTKRGEDIRGIENDIGRFLATGGQALKSGLANFGSGIAQLFTEEQLDTGVNQFASSYIMNDLHENGTKIPGMDKTWEELGYEGTSVVANMLPSVLVSAVAPYLGASAAVAGALGSATLGLSAGGNAYTQALSEGYTEDMARTYGTLVGASEGTLQYLLGGIGKLSGAGNLSNKALTKVASIENGLLRATAAAGVKAGGEIVEEELQNFLEPLYRTILFNEEYDAPTVEDIVYTAVLTFLTTGVMEAGEIASYASNKPATYGQQIKGAGSESLQALIESGLESAPETESRTLAEELNNQVQAGQTPGDWAVGRLAQANDAAIRAEAVEQAAKQAAEEQEARTLAQAQAVRDVYSESEKVPTSSETSRRTAAKPNYGEHGTETFNSIVETNTNADPVELMVRFDTPYQAGLTGLPMKQANLVNDFQIEAYNAGRMDYIQNMTNDAKKGPGVVLSEAESGFDHTNAPSDITQEYKDFSNWFADKLGVKGSWDGKNGKADYNAFFDSKAGGVSFAQDFGINPSLMKKLGSMDFMEKVDKLSATRDESFIFYVGHEMAGHVAKERAPKQMRAFFNAMYNYKQGLNADENLARSKQAFYASHNVKLDTDAAIEEVGSDSILELYDGDEQKFMDAMRRVYDSLDEDAKKGARTYLDVLKDYISKLKAWVRKLTGKENAEAKANAEKGISELERLRDMFEKAIGESMKAVKEARTTKRDGKLFRTTEADGTVILETSVGNPVAMMTEDGSAQFSLKTYEDFGRAELKRWLTLKESKGQITKEESADIVKQLDEYYDLCQNFIDKYAPFGAWSNAEVVRDNKGKPVFSVVKANGEYAMNLDFSLVCKKRRTLDAVFKEMIRRGIMDDLSLEEADIAKVNEIIRSNGFETACALCFVDSKRYRQAKVADTFVEQYNSIVRQLQPEDGSAKAHHFDFAESGVYKDRGVGLHTLSNAQLQPGIEKLKQIMRENGKQTVAHKIAKHLLNTPADRKLVSRSDFMNTDGFGAVKLKNPAVLKLYNSSKGAGGPKAAFSDVQYLGEILQKNNFTPERAYAVGGVRIQSFSDYIPRLVFDYLQMVADLSAKKLPAHAYTKEAIFVKQFGMTGIKMNMSLVPAVAEDGVAPGLDKNGDYFWFDGQSFGSDVKIKGSGKTGFELAIQIQNTPGYSQHCGTVAVGVSKAHIEKMLDDENIRMIIPYHKSSLNHIVAVMNNIDKYTDYTPVQNTRNADGKKITGKDFNFNEALRRTGDAKAAANEYLEWCKEHNYIPKFDAFAWHENYYKVLEDFSTYDNGVAAPQGAVTMTFPKAGDAFGSMAELIEQGLEEDAILEADREKSVPKIVDQVEKALHKKVESENAQEYTDTKYSLKQPMFKTKAEPVKKDDAYFDTWETNAQEAAKKYGLEDVEDRAIRKYVGGDAFEWTSIQRGEPDFERTEYVEWWIDNATAAFEKMPEYKGRTYRNLVFKTEDACQSFIKEHESGKSVELSAFTSTSKDPNGYVASGDYVAHMVVDGVSGKDISDTFGIPEQQEVVLMPGTVLRIDSVAVANDGNPLIYAREVMTNGKDVGADYRGDWESSSGTDDARRGRADQRDWQSQVHEGVSQDRDETNGGTRVRGSGGEVNSLKGERAMREEINRIRTDGRKAGKTEAEIEQDIMAVVDPEYGELVKTYGEIKRGERAARDIVVPQRTEKNRRVSQTVRTVLEAGVTPDAAVPTIQELITQGDFSYDRITDKAALAEADRTIRNKGFETAMADWLSDVKKGVVSKANTAMGWSLYNAAATKGDFKTAMTILDGMVRHQRSAAQALQATRILKKMSPDAQLYGIKKTVDSINEELQQRHGRKSGKRNVSDADNVPVELWMQKTGEILAEQLATAVKQKTRKEKTVSQRVLADLRKLAKETVTPTTMPADTRTEMDSIYDMFNNKEQYEKALQAAKETVAKEYGDKPEIMAALDKWMNTAFDYTAQLTKEITGQTEIQIPTELAEKFLSQTDQEGRDAVAREIYRYVGSQMPSTFMDKWNAWRYLAMLGNPRTHVRNIVGNLGFAPVVAAKNMTAGAIESAVSFVTGGKLERTKGVVNRKLLQAAWADYENVAAEVSAGGKYSEAANRNQYIEEGRTIFKFKPLEMARKGNSAALEAEDIWFARPHYAFALAQYCKAHGVTVEQLQKGKALGNARAYAIKEAQKATYKDTNAFSEFISKLGRYHGDNKVAKAASMVTEGILPFRKTPANILVRGIEYSPVGLLKSLTYDLYKVKKGDITAAEAIDNVAAGLTGTGLLAFGLWAAAEGLIRGAGGGDDEEKKYEELQGHQTYALELPDGTSITLDWLAPEVLPMFIGVNLYETATENKGESNLADMLTAVSNVTEPLLEMSCLQSLNDLFDSIGYASSGGLSALPSALASAATSYLTQAFPTILGQIERSAQDVRMTTYTEKDSFMTSDLQYTLGKVSAKIPGWDFNQIPYIDAWGRTESSGTQAENIANNFLNPAYMSQIETSAMEEELQRLYDATGEKGVLPERASKYFTVNGERKDLTAEEYVEYATARGQLSYDMLTDLMNRSEYRGLNDEERAEMVEMTMKYADAAAKATVSDYAPTGWISEAMNASEYADMDETDYMLYKVALSTVDKQNTSGTVGSYDSAEKAEAILSMGGFTDRDIAYLWDTKDGYSLLDAGIDMGSYVEYVSSGKSVSAEKLIDLHNNGVAEETYYEFLDMLKNVDEPTKSGKLGSYTQDEATLAIASMPGLSREERALLWQSVNKGWSSKNNPWG